MIDGLGPLRRHTAGFGAVLCALLAGCLWLATGAPAQQATQSGPKGPEPPQLAASAWTLVDARDGTELAGKSGSKMVPIASTTKLMTAYLTLARFDDLDKKLVAPGYDPLPAESVLGLQRGEKISVADLLTAMMLPSANDAAYTLAEGVAGSVPRFVRQMNAAARKLGLEDTSYDNPIGLDSPGSGSSARDLAALTLILRKDKDFRRIVAQTSATLETGAMPRTIETRNTLMLADPSVDGVKTGHTIDAGYVLVASAKREGVPLVSVVLGTAGEAERDAASEELLDYGYSLYAPRKAVGRGEQLGSMPVTDGAEDDVGIEAAKSFRVTARRDQKLTTELKVPAAVTAPVSAGERIGLARILLDGKTVGKVGVVAAAPVAAESLIDKAGGPLAVLLIAGGSILLLIALVLAWRRSNRGMPKTTSRGRTAEERSETRRQRMHRRSQENDSA